MRKPRLRWVRTPCPRCHAQTSKEAEERCKGPFCLASDISDKQGYIIAPTKESAERFRKWDEAQ